MACSDTIITQAFELFCLASICVVLVICGKKKPAKNGVIPPPVGANKTRTGTLKGLNETQKTGGTTTKSTAVSVKKSTKAGVDDDDDDVKFDIKIKKVEEKKDEFDDDEENPLAKIPTKPRAKKGHVPHAPGKPCPGATSIATNTTQTKTKTQEDPQNPECPLLAPNEKQIGVSCYQFEPSASAGTPAPTTKKTQVTTTKTEAPRARGPNTIETPVGAKSAMSMNLRKNKTKTCEQEPHTAHTNENKDQKLEKTQN